MQTLGYYCNLSVPLVKEAEKAWGSHLENLTEDNAYWLLGELCLSSSRQSPDYKTDAFSHRALEEMDADTRRCFIHALSAKICKF